MKTAARLTTKAPRHQGGWHHLFLQNGRAAAAALPLLTTFRGGGVFAVQILRLCASAWKIHLFRSKIDASKRLPTLTYCNLCQPIITILTPSIFLGGAHPPLGAVRRAPASNLRLRDEGVANHTRGACAPHFKPGHPWFKSIENRRNQTKIRPFQTEKIFVPQIFFERMYK